MPTSKKSSSNSSVFSDFELQAMKDRAKELKSEEKSAKKRELGEADVRKAIAQMPEPDQSMAKKVHEIVSKTAPELWPKTWYGMPAYAKDGKVVCFFQSGHKYESRYCTLGFADKAILDDGNMWPASFALKKLTDVEEQRIIELVNKAVS